MNSKSHDLKNEPALNEVISFLSSPAAFDDGTLAVKRIDTHASTVFLGKSIVYKIKRPVKYDYMDFSTLEKRKANCEHEFSLNKTMAPHLYLAVLAVTKEENNELLINGEGQPVEWAVKMRRFPEELVLKNIALENQFKKELCIDLGQNLASYHHSLNPIKVDDGALRIGDVIKELGHSLKPLEERFEGFQTSTLLEQLEINFSACLDDFNQRGQIGFIRRCHGDLHLNNIVITKDGPTPFDALEFDERLATIDVVYDLSFLLMDLLHMGLKQQANIVLHRYALKASELMNQGGFKILPLCLSIRSAIRAMVLSQQAVLQQPADRALLDEAKSYLSLSHQLLEKTPPVLLAVGGLSGTGKSTLALELASLITAPLGAFWLRSDLERKQMVGVSEFEHLSETHYSREMSSKVYEKMLEKAKRILSEGQPVLLDAVFLSEVERENVKDLAQQLNVPFLGLFLDAPLPTLLSRVGARSNDASDADQGVVKKQYDLKPDFSNCEEEGWVQIDASGTQAETLELAKMVLKDSQNQL